MTTQPGIPRALSTDMTDRRYRADYMEIASKLIIWLDDVRQSATAAGLLKDKQAEAAATAQNAAQAQRDAALAAEQAGRAAQAAAQQQAAYAAQAAVLRAQLDPMFAAQQRFNQAMDVADDLLRAGAITTREYAAAQRLARETLQQHAAAVGGTRGALEHLTPEIAKATRRLPRLRLSWQEPPTGLSSWRWCGGLRPTRPLTSVAGVARSATATLRHRRSCAAPRVCHPAFAARSALRPMTIIWARTRSRRMCGT